jgi:hypothetical protein
MFVVGLILNPLIAFRLDSNHQGFCKSISEKHVFFLSIHRYRRFFRNQLNQNDLDGFFK